MWEAPGKQIERALDVVDRMRDAGVEPNTITSCNAAVISVLVRTVVSERAH